MTIMFRATLTAHEPGRTVLLVDEGFYCRRRMRRILERQRLRVVSEVAEPEHALQRFTECKPDLTIVDLMDGPSEPEKLPGILLIRALRQLSPDACLVACTHNGDRETVVEAFRAGAQGFICKPYDEATFVEEIAKSLHVPVGSNSRDMSHAGSDLAGSTGAPRVRLANEKT